MRNYLVILIILLITAPFFSKIIFADETYVFDNFEGNWWWDAGDTNPSNGDDYWGIHDGTYYGKSAWCAENNDGGVVYGDHYDNHMNSYMKRTFDFSPYSTMTLEFDYLVECEANNYDYFKLLVNGSQKFYESGGHPDYWYPETINLDSYAGQSSVEIKFIFYSDYIFNQFMGAFVDNFYLHGELIPEPELSRYPLSLTYDDLDINQNYSFSDAFHLWNSGGGSFDWSITDNRNWLSEFPISGSNSGENDYIDVYIDTDGLNYNSNYSGTITIDAWSGSWSDTKTISVNISTIDPPDGNVCLTCKYPDGSLYTPTQYKVWDNDYSDLIIVNNPSNPHTFYNLNGNEIYHFEAYEDDMFMGNIEATVSPGQTINETLWTNYQSTITVRALYNDGVTPLPNATVKILNWEGTVVREAITDGNGYTIQMYVWDSITNTAINFFYDIKIYYSGDLVYDYPGNYEIDGGQNVTESCTTNVEIQGQIEVSVQYPGTNDPVTPDELWLFSGDWQNLLYTGYPSSSVYLFPDYYTYGDYHVQAMQDGIYLGHIDVILDENLEQVILTTSQQSDVQFIVYYIDGLTPISGAETIIKNQDGVEIRQGITDEFGVVYFGSYDRTWLWDSTIPSVYEYYYQIEVLYNDQVVYYNDNYEVEGGQSMVENITTSVFLPAEPTKSNGICVYPEYIDNILSNTDIENMLDDFLLHNIDIVYITVFQTVNIVQGDLICNDESGTWNQGWGNVLGRFSFSHLMEQAQQRGLQVIPIVKCFRHDDNVTVLPSSELHRNFLLNEIFPYFLESFDSDGKPYYPFDGIALDYIRYFLDTGIPADASIVTNFVDSVTVRCVGIPLDVFLKVDACEGGHLCTHPLAPTPYDYAIYFYGQDWVALSSLATSLDPMSYVDQEVYGENPVAWFTRVKEAVETIRGYTGTSIKIQYGVHTYDDDINNSHASLATIQTSLCAGSTAEANGFFAYRYYNDLVNQPAWMDALSDYSTNGPDYPLAILSLSMEPSPEEGIRVTADACSSFDYQTPFGSLEFRFMWSNGDGTWEPWTAWSSSPIDYHDYPEQTTAQIVVQVKDEDELTDIERSQFTTELNTGTIEGIVTLEGGTSNVEDVLVIVNGFSTNPDPTGYYVIDNIPLGLYDVTASLESYGPETVPGVEVISGDVTIVDITLYYLLANQVLSPDSYDYGNQQVWTSSSYFSFTLLNTGNATANGNISLTDTNPDQFQIHPDDDEDFNLSAGDSRNIRVLFAPTSIGSKSATLFVDGTNGTNDVSASLTGTGTEGSNYINIPQDYSTIQEGINAASNGDIVLVQPGTYVENINFNSKNITVGSLFLTSQDTIYISQTVIDGDSSGTVVKFENGEGSTAVLTGFIITNGNDSFGGGIYCYNNSSPTLENVTISDNSANYFGGGIYCYNSNPNLDNVTISGNSAMSSGGGIYCNYSNPSLENVTIENNSVTGNVSYGGGIYCYNSNPGLDNVTISDNSADYGGGIRCTDNSNPSLYNVAISYNSANQGGGIYCYNNSSPTLENVTISYNSADYGGGIRCTNNSNPTLYNVTISYNSADYIGGGGVLCTNNSNPSLYNVVISNNSADKGGGIHCYFSSPSLENVTITDNSANYGGGIYCRDNSNPSFVNCILWNDSPQEIYFYESVDPNTITISYSDIQGGEAGIVTNNNGTVSWLDGNIDADPLFVDPANRDYHLSWVNYPIPDSTKSPCIDSGDPNSLFDLDGTISDMGAYYFNQGIILLSPPTNPNPVNGATDISLNTSISWTNGYYTETIDLYFDTIYPPTTLVLDNFPAVETYDPETLNYNTTYFWQVFCQNTSGETWGNIWSFSTELGYYGPVWYISTTGSDILGDGSFENPFKTIQYGINTANINDTILVHPGTYLENINYNGKNITVGSLFLTTQDTIYISQTVIDGDSNGSVIIFENGEDSTAVLTGFTITNGNTSFGGGIRCFYSSPSLDNVMITGNLANYYGGGGGIYCSGSSLTLEYVTISNNSARTGGGIYCANSNPSLENVTISYNNSTASWGGGIYCIYSSPSLVNVTISDNSAPGYGGGIYCHNSNPTLENVMISNNSADYYGGGIYCYNNSNPNLINCILWNDSPQEIYIYSGSVAATYCDIQGGWTGDGNIDADPLFVDPTNGDYHLTASSPCIDAGDPASPLDPDGTIADMGAYYFHQTIAPDPPQSITIEIIGTDVHLSWDAVTGANSYKIYSSDDPYAEDWGEPVGSVAGLSWNADISGMDKKFYYVKASTETIRSKDSDSQDAYQPDRKSRRYDLDKYINRRRK